VPHGTLLQVVALPEARRDSLEAGTRPASPGLSLRSNFAWVLTGNIVYAACQWGMIVALARLGNSFMVGQFSLGLAIATPVLVFTNLHLRAVQATDARRLYSFKEYLQLRTAMTLAAMVVIAGIVWLGHYERRTAMVILAVASAKGIETLSDIHYGLFQLNDRLDQTGRSMMIRGILSAVVLSTGIYLTRSVFWGCAGLALAWLATLLLFDVRRGRRFASRWAPGFHLPWNLMRLAMPLGIVTTMASINLNMPRYFIHARMGEHQLGIFSAMAYATVAMTLVSDSMGHCTIPRLARLYAGGRRAEFRSLLVKLLSMSATLGLAGVAVVQVMGARLLTLFYGTAYAAHSRIFILLMFATALQCVAGVLSSGIMSARCFRIQVPMLALVVGSGALACARWVPTAGLAGGAAAMIVSSAVYLALASAVMAYLLLAPVSRVPGRPQPGIDGWEPGL
jgi:O-antigen/teichoic acid export membrane protein